MGCFAQIFDNMGFYVVEYLGRDIGDGAFVEEIAVGFYFDCFVW